MALSITRRTLIGIVVGVVIVIVLTSIVASYFLMKKVGGVGGSDSGPSKFDIECLNAHDHYRALHGTPKMEINSNITKYAQEWSEELIRIDKMEHRQQQTYGENIYSTSGTSTVPCEHAVGAWYSEIKLYKYEDPKFDVTTGHFTQVVWKDTKQVGCGFAEKNKKVYIVCNYLPPGNWEGAFASNVPKPL